MDPNKGKMMVLKIAPRQPGNDTPFSDKSRPQNTATRGDSIDFTHSLK